MSEILSSTAGEPGPDGDSAANAKPQHPLFKRLAVNTPSAVFFQRTLLSVDEETNTVRLRFHAPPECANVRGDVQGGFVGAMLDSTAGAAMVAVLKRGQSCVTLDLNIRYLRPTPLGELFGVGRLLHVTDSIGFTEGQLFSPDGILLAVATSTLRIRQRPDRSAPTSSENHSGGET